MATALRAVELRPAEFHATSKPTVIRTVLGSCVAICLVGGPPGTGAACHCLLPTRTRTSTGPPGAFVDEALEVMLGRLARRGVPPAMLRAKLFGGADMFGTRGAGVRQVSVGRQNIEMARRLLAERGIPVVDESTGGDLGRKIFFNTASGEVRLRWLGRHRLEQAA